MKRILVTGGSGMLGHKLCSELAGQFEVYATVRGSEELCRSRSSLAGLGHVHIRCGVDAGDLGSLTKVLDEVKPQGVVNGIGIVKQREEANHAVPAITINSLFPHQLADICADRGIRLIHLSTDCVFSGKNGPYKETDIPDPIDLYGRSKLLGEVKRKGCLTLRTSIIGWELEHRAGLIEWFAVQRGKTICGYRKAIYSGLSTTAIAKLIGMLLTQYPQLSGLYQVATQPISKYEILVALRDALGWHDIAIKPDDIFECDRSMDGSRFERDTGWRAPAWPDMIRDLAAEWPQYEQWRRVVKCNRES